MLPFDSGGTFVSRFDVDPHSSDSDQCRSLLFLPFFVPFMSSLGLQMFSLLAFGLLFLSSQFIHF